MRYFSDDSKNWKQNFQHFCSLRKWLTAPYQWFVILSPGKLKEDPETACAWTDSLRLNGNQSHCVGKINFHRLTEHCAQGKLNWRRQSSLRLPQIFRLRTGAGWISYVSKWFEILLQTHRQTLLTVKPPTKIIGANRQRLCMGGNKSKVARKDLWYDFWWTIPLHQWHRDLPNPASFLNAWCISAFLTNGCSILDETVDWFFTHAMPQSENDHFASDVKRGVWILKVCDIKLRQSG